MDSIAILAFMQQLNTEVGAGQVTERRFSASAGK
jgi:hypothetical protein